MVNRHYWRIRLGVVVFFRREWVGFEKEEKGNISNPFGKILFILNYYELRVAIVLNLVRVV